MSSSSDDSRTRSASLTALLEGVARECSTLGNAIAAMGDDLSGALESEDPAQIIGRFQHFDILAQNAHAQARMIVHAARLILTHAPVSLEELLDLIEDMPIHDVRHRLKTLVAEKSGAVLPAALAVVVAAGDDDEDMWFDEPAKATG